MAANSTSATSPVTPSGQASAAPAASSSAFAALGLRPELLRALAEQGYDTPTPIQAQGVPAVLSGRDVLGAAQTGTGKTAAFTLPMLQTIAAMPADKQRPVRGLVMTPTRELCVQVEESVRTYGKYIGVRSTAIFGGVGMGNQFDALRRGPRIVVATPGRLLDHISQRSIDLSNVSFVVLDEADRMLDMGFIHDIKRLFAMLPKARQTLLFSATFSPEIRKLASSFLRDPVSIEVAPRNSTAQMVTQTAHRVDKDAKRQVLSHLIRTRGWSQVLVFTKTKHGANRLAELLEKDGITADAIHGNKSQNQRQRALNRFKDGEVTALVATDVAARGIDISLLPIVVNYDLPNVPEDYVHRIGRTARAGASGEAVSLVSGEDRPLLAAIEALMKRTIPMRPLEGFVPAAGTTDASSDEGITRRPDVSGRGGRGGRGEASASDTRGAGSRSGQGRGGQGRSGSSGAGQSRGGDARGAQPGAGAARGGRSGDGRSQSPRPPGTRAEGQRGDGVRSGAPRGDGVRSPAPRPESGGRPQWASDPARRNAPTAAPVARRPAAVPALLRARPHDAETHSGGSDSSV